MLKNMAPLRLLLYDFITQVFPWSYRDMLSPYWRFYWNRTAGGEFAIAGQTIPMTPSHFFILPGYLRFSSRAKRPFDQFYIHFNPGDHVLPAEDGLWWRLPADAATLEIIRSACIAPAATEEQNYASSLAVLAVLSRSLLRLPPGALSVAPRRDPRVAAAEGWLAFPTNRPPGNTELAARLHMSRNSFIRLFRKSTGEAPQAYGRRKRLEHACELLHFTDETIDTIAARTGFPDRYHFTRAFARLLRTSPARFRNAIGGNPPCPQSPSSAPTNSPANGTPK